MVDGLFSPLKFFQLELMGSNLRLPDDFSIQLRTSHSSRGRQGSESLRRSQSYFVKRACMQLRVTSLYFAKSGLPSVGTKNTCRQLNEYVHADTIVNRKMCITLLVPNNNNVGEVIRMHAANKA